MYLSSRALRLGWQVIVLRQNEHQIEDAEKMAGELGVDSIIFKRGDFPRGEDKPDLAERWLPQRSKLINENPFDRPYKETGDRCWRLWRTSVVTGTAASPPAAT